MAGLPGIVLRIGANTKDALDGINQIEGRLGKFGNAAKAAFAGVAAGFTLGAVKDQIGQAIDAASNLNESMSKVNVVFGSSSTDIVEWSKTSAKSMLLSQQATLEAAGTFGNLFQAFGLTRDKSAEMSKTLVQLAADLASFNNTSVDDAIEALRSGISGEAEPLKRYGVALTDVRLRAEAMAQGIYDGKGALDVAQKAQASYALILKDTALAQGDVKRTSAGFANTMRTISASIEDARAKFGEGLVAAIGDASAAIGGPGGLSDAIEGAGDKAGDFVVGLETGLKQSITLANQLKDAIPFQNADGNTVLSWVTRLTGGPGFSTFMQSLVSGFNDVSYAGELNAKMIGRQAELTEAFNQDAKDLADTHVALAAKTYAATTAFDREAASANKVGDGVESIKVGAERSISALQRLQGALEGIFSTAGSFGQAQEKFAQGIAWTQLLSQGPGKSGSKTTKVPTGKQTAVNAYVDPETGDLVAAHMKPVYENQTTQYSTKADYLAYAQQLVSQAVATAKTLGPKAANKLLQNAQDRVTQLLKQAGYQDARAQAAALIGPVNINPHPRPWEQMYDNRSRTNVDPSRTATQQRNSTSRANSRSAQRSAKTNARP